MSDLDEILSLRQQLRDARGKSARLRRVMKEFADTRNPAIPLWISLKASKVLANESYEQAMAREHGPDLIRER